MRQNDIPTYRTPAYRPTISRLVYEGVGVTLFLAVAIVAYCIACPPEPAAKVSYTRALLPISQGR